MEKSDKVDKKFMFLSVCGHSFDIYCYGNHLPTTKSMAGISSSFQINSEHKLRMPPFKLMILLSKLVRICKLELPLQLPISSQLLRR